MIYAIPSFLINNKCRGERLAKSTGHSIQMAEFNAAKKAIEDCGHLFPHLTYQKRVLERSFKSQGLDFVRLVKKLVENLFVNYCHEPHG